MFDAASLEINHELDHCAVRVEGQILKPPSAMDCAHGIVERVCDNAEAADLPELRALREALTEAANAARSTMAYIECPPEIPATRLLGGDSRW